MKNTGIKDPIFLQAVEAIDNGDLPVLKELVANHPYLITDRYQSGEKGYFKDPYLLWFVADNPIRRKYMPGNIVVITEFLIQCIKEQSPINYQHQINYTLGLVGTGRIPKESGQQIELMKLLIDAGAKPGNGHGEIANGNIDAAKYLIERGGELTLTTALCLNLQKEVEQLLSNATATDKQIALLIAAFFGDAEKIKLLLKHGANVNGYLDASSGFHHHATALHQAIYSGSLEAVELLVNANADLHAIDKIYDGTPLDWAMYMQTETNDDNQKKKYAAIEIYLRSKLS